MKSLILTPLALVCMLVSTGMQVHAADGPVDYTVRIRGTRDRAVRQALRETTATFKLRRHPPATTGQLRRRMEKDQAAIEAILHSRGYYDGKLSMELDTGRQPARITLTVTQGERYRFGRITLQLTGETDAALASIKPRVRSGQHVTARAIFEEQQRILDQLTYRGYPFPTLQKRSVVLHRQSHTVDVLLIFNPGEKARFGVLRVEGLTRLPEPYIRRQVPWATGTPYDAQAIRNFERKLLSSGAFGSVRVTPLHQAEQTNTVPISVRVSERAMRTVRLGVNYSDIGPGTKAYWEHRNIFGGGEQLKSALEWNPIRLEGATTLTRSGFLDASQSLVLDLTGSIDTPDAYDARKLTGTAMMMRDFTTRIQGGIGLGDTYSRVEQLADDDIYNFIIFPLQALYDSRNDTLNPVRGARLLGRTAYYRDTLGSQSFLKSQLEWRQYATWSDRYRLSHALRLSLASIDGASLTAVPADERLYAGGGGSIRGYAYQAVGPRLDGIPTGGEKAMEFSVELRLQPGRRLGYALFLDGGTVFEDSSDDLDRSLRYGAGVGLRWFTTLGPLRTDLAYPLNPDDTQRNRPHVYISLGQAF